MGRDIHLLLSINIEKQTFSIFSGLSLSRRSNKETMGLKQQPTMFFNSVLQSFFRPENSDPEKIVKKEV